MKLLPAIEQEFPAGKEVDAAVIWLHGLGADGSDFASIVPQLPHSKDFGIRFVFPHAPSIPVTINNGFVMPAWYDIIKMDIGRNVDTVQLVGSAQAVHGLIDREIQRGVSADRIIVAGFSQGGAVALQAALTYPESLAGVIALSTYFATADSIKVNPSNKQIPIRICHGIMDPVVPEAMGKLAKRTLESMGFKPEYTSYPMVHAVCMEEIRDIGQWITKILA